MQRPTLPLSSHDLGVIIAHSAGEVNGYCYTNSLEALLANIGSARAVEVDVVRCSDSFIVAHDGQEKEYGLELPFDMVEESTFLETRYRNCLTPISLRRALQICDATDRKLVLDVKGSESSYKDFVSHLESLVEPSLLGQVAVLQAYSVDEVEVARQLRPFGILGATWKYGLYPESDSANFADFVSILESVQGEVFAGIAVPASVLAGRASRIHLKEIASWMSVYVHGHPHALDEEFIEEGFGVFSHLSPTTATWTPRNELEPALVKGLYSAVLGRDPESAEIVTRICSEDELTVREFGQRVVASDEFRLRYEASRREAQESGAAFHSEWLDPLFESGVDGCFTDAAGLSSARFAQHTNLSEKVVGRILDLFDAVGLEYVVFAGSLVGYVRDRRVPKWLDDVDVMILEDQVEKFEELVIPRLRRAGFLVGAVEGFPGAGYQVVGMQLSDDRRARTRISDGISVEIPWPQVDVFFARVDRNGLLRSPGGWGLFHQMDVPAEWAWPATRVPIHGGLRPVFGRFERDISRQYGDVHRNVVISSHDPEAACLAVCDTDWFALSDDFEERYIRTPRHVPPLVEDDLLNRYAPNADVAIGDFQSFGLEELCLSVLEVQAGTLVLSQRENFFWAMDLTRIFPSLRLVARPMSTADVSLAVVTFDLFDEIESPVHGVQRRIDESLQLLVSLSTSSTV